MSKLILFVAAFCLFNITCKIDRSKNQANGAEVPVVKLKVPMFVKDSAYAFIQKQLSFGSRVPGTVAHTSCGDWLVAKGKSFGANVIEQPFKGQTHTGLKFDARNIILSYNPTHKARVILAAHWDSRFEANEDPDSAKRKQAVMGADDGASGVGVLLEVARQLQVNPIPNMGVDILFLDAEDQGGEGTDGSDWGLGAQHWSRNKHISAAKFGILLDMVGSPNPRFPKEGYSVTYAGPIVDKVWSLAQKMGFAHIYVNENSTPVHDDHYFINTIAGIPMIDIINRPTNSSFVKCWHTTCDDISSIDIESLRATGQVVLAVVYRESNGDF